MILLNRHSKMNPIAIGYGDIFPPIETVRSFTILEAVLGQLYLAVIVARLVGMQISQSDPRA
ncbi:MAG: ion channel [Desulfobacterales bacterium]